MNASKSRPVLVTGATGFTGGYLVRALVDAGYPVRAIVRSATKATSLPRGVDVVEADIRDPAAVLPAAEGIGIVYHLAAAYREAAHREASYREVNVGATRNLLEAAAVHGVERFVHCSTVGVLGHVATPPADETTPYSPGDPYQRTKCEAEVLALTYARDRGVPVTVARPTAIYGPGDRRLLKMFRMIANRTFVMLGKGDIYYHMVYIDDLVDGLRLLAHHPAAVGEVFILGGERYYSLETIAGMVARYLDVPPPRLRLPAWPAQMAGTLCEKICIPFGIEPPIYRRRVDFFTKSRAFSIEKARRVLGYDPKISLEVGLQRTLDWCLRTGQITRGSAIAAVA
ncbi:MAG TPA: NAD-dependent epimerase/dehydratase family protein [Gemmatimonadales bacterium]|nr:NAD-dependent epimerase/dehydratase family protein [Gemmatimonadales bacterium]